jgi:hypothetical protein
MKTLARSWSKMMTMLNQLAGTAADRFAEIAQRASPPGEFSRPARSEEDLT